MIRRLLILVLLIVSYSCSCKNCCTRYCINKDDIPNNRYYSYEDDDKYCTVEVINNKPTFRAIYKVEHDGLTNYRYVYLKSDESYWCSMFYSYYLRVDKMIYLDSDDFEFSRKYFEISNFDKEIDYCYTIYFYPKKGKYFSFYSGCSETEDLEEKHKKFIEVDDWLPPYFKAVKRIKYSKFSKLNIKKKYLKDPEIEGSPKSWEEKDL